MTELSLRIFYQILKRILQNLASSLNSGGAQRTLCMVSFADIRLHPSHLRLLVARNGFLLILMRKLLSLNTKCFFHQSERIQMSLISRSLSLKKNSVLHLSIILEQIVSTLIGMIKHLYDNDSVQCETLQEAVNSVLETFLRRRDIALIDQFAILNTLKKKGFGFRHESQYWEVSFGLKSNFRLGKSKVLVTLDSSTFFQKFRLIMSQLEQNPKQHDLLCLMYMTIMNTFEHRVKPVLPFPFELTITTNYQFWLSSIYLNWDTKRSEFLDKCKCQFVRRPFFSKKDSNYYFQHTNTSSFREFFANWHISNHDVFKGKINDLSF
jgi:hypothetical protein